MLTVFVNMVYIMLVRPETLVFRADLYFAVLFFVFSPRDLRAPSADHHETLHLDGKCVRFYNPGSKFQGALPKKI